MKIMTVLGTRPEIIRLSLIIKKLDKYTEHVLVHTGQNYDPNLSDIFFSDLRIRKPDYYLGVEGASFGEQIGKILTEFERVIHKEKPDRILILGDTNSGLVAIIAKRLGIPVFHMEAGNRCYDYRVPEEVNRKIIDHSSTILLPYTNRSKENLLEEGIISKSIYVTGNPINEVIEEYIEESNKSDILNKLSLENNKYMLVTMHRAENVDMKHRLKIFLKAFDLVQKKYKMPIIFSLHPRTKAKMEQFNITLKNKQLRFLDPFGFLDFIKLEKNAYCVMSDSGTVQEECAIFKVPNITIRDVTERPETLTCGSNILSGNDPENILQCLEVALNEKNDWTPPEEYMEKNVSRKVVKILLGYYSQFESL